MPVIEGVDWFLKDTFTTPPYASIQTGAAITRDTATLHDADLASMKITATGTQAGVTYPDISSGHARIWSGVWYRLNSLDTGDTDILRHEGTAGGVSVIAYASASGLIYHYIVGGATFPTVAYTLNTWIWVQHITDYTSSPIGGYTRINDTDLTAVTLAGTATTGRRVILQSSAHTSTAFYSTHLWGYANSTTDWLDRKDALAFHPNAGVVIADTLAATSVSQSFTMPWELIGSSSTIPLGQIANTQSIVRVFDQIARPPAGTDDATQGYTIGDLWIFGGSVYWCTSASANAAVWKKSA